MYAKTQLIAVEMATASPEISVELKIELIGSHAVVNNNLNSGE